MPHILYILYMYFNTVETLWILITERLKKKLSKIHGGLKNQGLNLKLEMKPRLFLCVCLVYI